MNSSRGKRMLGRNNQRMPVVMTQDLNELQARGKKLEEIVQTLRDKHGENYCSGPHF